MNANRGTLPDAVCSAHFTRSFTDTYCALLVSLVCRSVRISMFWSRLPRNSRIHSQHANPKYIAYRQYGQTHRQLQDGCRCWASEEDSRGSRRKDCTDLYHNSGFCCRHAERFRWHIQQQPTRRDRRVRFRSEDPGLRSITSR